MIDPVGQLGFIRDMQRSFVHGGGGVDPLQILSYLLMVGIPAFILYFVWRHFRFIAFYFSRLTHTFLEMGKRHKINTHLMNSKALMSVLTVEKEGAPRPLCTGRVVDIGTGFIVLDLKTKLSSAKPHGRLKVICFCKPFLFAGKRVNAFETYTWKALNQGGMVQSLMLFTPAVYGSAKRRMHLRKKIMRSDAVKMRIWTGAKKLRFQKEEPDFVSESLLPKGSRLPTVSVGNISPGGMKLVVEPRGNPMRLRQGHEIVIRFVIYDPRTKRYVQFLFDGTVRSVFSMPGDRIGLGIKFMASGREMGDPGNRVEWKVVDKEIPALAKLLEAAGKPGNPA